ncbi:MAG: undecaprenyl-diphosphatase UppP [Desulfobulbaceae bacterium]|nr:undecaprenyl-diphosphatase UppP [Desulfobulbaceae bacterium]
MQFIEPFLLGVLQGATEFLPVSSSGHLVLAEALFNIQEAGMTFDVALHMGTLVAILLYFRKDLLAIAGSLFHPGSKDDAVRHNQHLALLLIVATIPAALIGKLFGDQIEENFRQPWVVAATLAGVGLILLWAEKTGKRQRSLSQLRLADAIVIGLAQVCALVPGVSRSGITMTVGLFRHLDRTAAARFSFLMSAPIIAGAGLLNLLKIIKMGGLSPDQGSFFLIGFLASAISGYLVIAFLMRFIQTRSFAIFAYYRLVLAAVVVYTLLR